MNSTPRPPARLFAIFARQANVAVLFRRGPTRWVRLIKWDTASDRLELGHWFHGRIYERRCDLSPDGRMLIYFASKFSGKTLADPEYTFAWTAISKIPWLTALALWPKGDCWHGGGLFEDNKTVMLNHRPAAAQPHPKHQPKRLVVRANPKACGEDDPLFAQRLARDGWGVRQEWRWHMVGWSFVTDMPEIRIRRHPFKSATLWLTRSLSGHRYTEKFAVQDGASVTFPDLSKATWAVIV